MAVKCSAGLQNKAQLYLKLCKICSIIKELAGGRGVANNDNYSPCHLGGMTLCVNIEYLPL